jgi:hypothetical protein
MLDDLEPPGWGQKVGFDYECDMNYGMAKLKVLAVVSLQMDTVAAPSATSTCGGFIKTLGIVSRISDMPQGIS